MKKLAISLLTGLFIIGSSPVQTQEKVYGDIYTYEYVYDFYGNIMTNKDGSVLTTRVRHSINSVEEFDFWLDNNFNNPVYMSR